MDTILQIGLSNSATALVLAVVAAVVGLRGRRPALVHALFRNDSAYLGGAVANSPLDRPVFQHEPGYSREIAAIPSQQRDRRSSSK